MHVSDIWTCDQNGNSKTTFSRPGTVYWKTKIVDAGGSPVAGVTVTCDLYRPDGSLWVANKTSTTDAGGIASNSNAINQNSSTGTYTIRVKSVVKTGWTYNSGANIKTETTFVVQ